MKTPRKYDPNLIGYARVSTREQNLDLQREALIRAGVDPQNIFEEHVSGAAARRPMRDAALRQCRPGCTLVVWKLDRVSRSLIDLLTLVQKMEADGIAFRSLTETIDTSSPLGRVFLAMLGAFAQFERDTIQARIKAGVDRSIAKGTKFGKPTIFTKPVQAKITEWLRDGESAVQIAKRLKCHPNSLRRVYTRKIIDSIRAGKNPRIVTTTKRTKKG